MIRKDSFCKALRMIKEQEEIDAQFSRALQLVGDGPFVFGSENKYLAALREVLKEAVGDQYDYIDWWLYEATGDYEVWEADNSKRYCLKEPEALYDYITGVAAPIPGEVKKCEPKEVSQMAHRLPPLSEPERIEQSVFGERIDEILDRVDKEDAAFIITENGKDKVVIQPYLWFAENFSDAAPEVPEQPGELNRVQDKPF